MSSPPQETYDAIQRFLATAKRPVVIEAGQEPIPLASDSYVVEWESGGLVLQAWTSDRNLVRKVTGMIDEKPGKLALAIERFGKREGAIELVDLDRPRSDAVTRRASRQTYAEQFRRSLLRQFAGWRIASISTDPDLEHSLSPSYPRALLRKGTAGWAAIGASAKAQDIDGVLSFGLIWLDYLRKRETRLSVEGLAVFVPEGHHRTTCLRMKHLDQAAARWAVYAYGDGFEELIDLENSGNLDTCLPVRAAAVPAEVPVRFARLQEMPGVECVQTTGGRVSFRVRGLEFAYAVGTDLFFGVDGKRQLKSASTAEVEAIARELLRLRSALAEDRRNPLFTRSPELWLESAVREHIDVIDAGLQKHPVYGQAPAFAGGDRGVIDLLASDTRGRLAVLELKVSEDLHLPLQSLDYWMRVRWHAANRDFGPSGYFPGIELTADSPRLFLIAPALAFHPTTEIILRYFPANLHVVRIGVGMEWQKNLKVVFRAEGARATCQ